LKVGPTAGEPTAAEDNDEQSWVVLCYDSRSGTQLWQKAARRAPPRATRHEKATHANTTMATDGEHLVAFFGSEGLYCYNLDGRLLWSRDLGVINVSKYGIGWGWQFPFHPRRSTCAALRRSC
jgi:outer membrane protein assembly factor BamB